MNNFVNDYPPLGRGRIGIGGKIHSTKFRAGMPRLDTYLSRFKCNLTKELPVFIFHLW